LSRKKAQRAQKVEAASLPLIRFSNARNFSTGFFQTLEEFIRPLRSIAQMNADFSKHWKNPFQTLEDSSKSCSLRSTKTVFGRQNDVKSVLTRLMTLLTGQQKWNK